ncbi:MAG TPA: N-acetyl-alpha-D-glucosaminyl L-malate synthase BshA [Gemmatimonadetes bacterium]|nr:N-acetyl-alpha-D-glucosaminyl L-malate synthase BshA [Gemmatimonadota bacterium]
MKIGITCYPTYGGSGAVATNLGLELAERGHEVHFISYDQPFRLAHFHERIFFHEVEMEDYPLFKHPPYSLALAVALHDAVRKHELDLVHVHYAIPHATSAWIACEMLKGERDLKIVTTLHGTDITLVGLHPSFQAITQFSILRSHGLTAVSDFLKRETVRDFSVPESRIEVVPNFVNTRIYRPGLEPCHRATLAPDGEKIVMHISNFRPVKRVEDVVEIFARVLGEIPSRLVLVGDGPDLPRARVKVEELGIRDSVVFLGEYTPVQELLSCSDLFLLPSGSESFGLAALEAMACGSPVVASRVGGLPEVIMDGETGYLCEAGDIDEMAAASIKILSDDKHRKELSDAGRAFAVKHFSSECIVPQYEEYYRRILGSRSS